MVLVLLVAIVATATIARSERVSPVTDPVVKQECGSCHMVFPPQLLPKRSWQKLLETLADHFGENASLDEAQRKAILDYLLANAADSPQAGREGRKFGQSIAAGQTPLRITDTPRWVRAHREVQADRWESPQLKSKANCLACHKKAEQGIYEDDEGH
jgi:hypothetical protein